MNRSYLLCLVAILVTPVYAGDSAKNPPTLEPAPPANPLSFFDGRLVFDLHERLRFEARENNFDFNDAIDSPTDDGWLLQRFRVGVKIKPVDWLTIYAQGQDVREIGSDRTNIIGQLGAEGDDSFDLRQGFVQIGHSKGLSARIGRQLLSYGDERLVGPLDWLNQGRSFDALKFHFETPSWWIDAFTSSVVNFERSKFNQSDWMDGEESRNQTFSGIYFSTTAIDTQTTDLYVFQLHEGGGSDADFFTFGTRWKADVKKLKGWDYEVEMAGQAGELQGRDLGAFAGHWGAGYIGHNLPWKPRIFAEYNFATGDDNPADDDIGTFQNLFPTNHKFYGFMDVFSWKNLHNPAISLSVQPHQSLTARLDYHLFWLADTHDAWYRANGITAVRPITPGAESFAGSEVDLTLTWKATACLGLQAGYSHFFAGGYLRAAGSKASDDADFAYLMATIEF
jgi:hypothetical protein